MLAITQKGYNQNSRKYIVAATKELVVLITAECVFKNDRIVKGAINNSTAKDLIGYKGDIDLSECNIFQVTDDHDEAFNIFDCISKASW